MAVLIGWFGPAAAETAAGSGQSMTPAAPSPPPAAADRPRSLPPQPGRADESTGTQPAVKELGEERYRIGAVVVDKRGRSFTVPGTVIRLEPPLEFVAVTKNGYKRYESLLELETNAFDFNLACILIGLDSERAKRPRHHFDPEPVEGDPVEVTVAWEQDSKLVEIPVASLFNQGGKPVEAHDWVYTGSAFLPDGRYMAALSGTLLSFVHDPESIIQHRQGLGLGRYGSVEVNIQVAPPLGKVITVTVRHHQS
jgi:hypothetical protein